MTERSVGFHAVSRQGCGGTIGLWNRMGHRGGGGGGGDGRWKCCQRNVFLEISCIVEIMAVFFLNRTAAITA